MASLSDAIPRDLFRGMFENVSEEVVAKERTRFYRRDPNGASTVNLFCWDEAVHRGAVDDGEEMKDFHPSDLGKAYQLTKKRIGEEPFKEVFCTTFFNEHSRQLYRGQRANFPFAQIDLVHCYPNDIHISDVVLADLTRPVVDRSSVARRSHAGLHVFPALLEGLIEVANEKGAQRLSLVAASPAAHDVFSRYGFAPTDTQVSQYAFQNFGHSHAMALTVA
jgi:hypothetical protein